MQLSTVHHLQGAFEEASTYSRYNPNKGYSWDFASNKACKWTFAHILSWQRAKVLIQCKFQIPLVSEKSRANSNKGNEKTKEEPSSMFQRQRVDMLLGELLRKFPLPMTPLMQQAPPPSQQTPNQNGISGDGEQTIDGIKQEPSEHQNNGIRHNDNDIDGDGKIDMKPPPEKKSKLNWRTESISRVLEISLTSEWFFIILNINE